MAQINSAFFKERRYTATSADNDNSAENLQELINIFFASEVTEQLEIKIPNGLVFSLGIIDNANTLCINSLIAYRKSNNRDYSDLIANDKQLRGAVLASYMLAFIREELSRFKELGVKYFLNRIFNSKRHQTKVKAYCSLALSLNDALTGILPAHQTFLDFATIKYQELDAAAHLHRSSSSKAPKVPDSAEYFEQFQQLIKAFKLEPEAALNFSH
jgi:hypothetical protein